METLAEVAEGLRSLRAELGLTQAQLAKLASVPRVTLARMETASQGVFDATLATRLETLANHLRQQLAMNAVSAVAAPAAGNSYARNLET